MTEQSGLARFKEGLIDFPCKLPTTSLYLADMLVEGAGGPEVCRLLASSPRELLNIARAFAPIHVVFHELRDLCRMGIDDSLQEIQEFGVLPDGSVEYALASGERYVAWTGTNPERVTFLLGRADGDIEPVGKKGGTERVAGVAPNDQGPQ
jgi:hypothetical protein